MGQAHQKLDGVNPLKNGLDVLVLIGGAVRAIYGDDQLHQLILDVLPQGILVSRGNSLVAVMVRSKTS